MRKFLLLFFGILCGGSLALTQPNKSVGIGTTTPNAKAILDIYSITQGFLMPRMNTTQREAMPLTGPDIGMMVYDHTEKSPMYWQGTGWRHVGYAANFWSRTGDDLYYTDGSIAIGTTVPSYKLHIDNDDEFGSAYFVNDFDGTQSKYGIRNTLQSTGTGAKYGYYGVTTANSTATNSVYGVRSYVNANNSDAVMFGVYGQVSSTGDGTHYGVYGSANGDGNYAVYGTNTYSAGWAGYFNGRGVFTGNVGLGKTASSYQVDIESDDSRALNIVNNYTGSSSTYGIRAQISDGANSGTRYGILSDVNLADGHTALAYGLYTHVESDGTGTHYGVYSSATGTGNWAGYFVGRGRFSSDLEISNKIFLQPTGEGSGAAIRLYDNDGTENIQIYAGESSGTGASIKLYNEAGSSGSPAIELDAEQGTDGPGRVITGELEITAGADVAEFFAVNDIIAAEPGMLLSIDPQNVGQLVVTTMAYDKKLAGVISGANGVRPGMYMGQKESVADGDVPVAIAGRVFVMATSRNGLISPGDLLTSSDIPGIAMKVTDHEKARGAVIGKAMTELREETGFVLILVSLQ